MATFYDHIQGKFKSIKDSVLTNGGLYVDGLSGEIGYIPPATSAGEYFDPLLGRMAYRPVAGATVAEDFLFDDNATPFFFDDGSQFEFSS